MNTKIINSSNKRFALLLTYIEGELYATDRIVAGADYRDFCVF
jgi:hypothetical protein